MSLPVQDRHPEQGVSAKDVFTLDEAMESADYFLDILLEDRLGPSWTTCAPTEVDAVLLQLLATMSDESVSTCCTGIDTGHSVRSPGRDLYILSDSCPTALLSSSFCTGLNPPCWLRCTGLGPLCDTH